MGRKSIDDGVGGHEGARAARPGFRWFRPALGGGALLAALAALVVVPLFAAAPAEARVSVDACETNAPSPPGERRVCASKIYTIPPYEFGKDHEFIGPSDTCDAQTEKIAGTNRNKFGDADGFGLAHSALIAHWDYWTFRGEWVAWTGIGDMNQQPGSGFAIGYHPWAKNWSPWPWQARAWLYCDHRPAQRSQGSLSSRTHAGETVESGDSGDDVIKGDGEDDALVGEGGDDALHGAGGDDEFVGGFGDDSASGGGGDDYYVGGGGEDTARGGDGDDQLLGGPHDDTAFGGAGSDELFDDEGNDELHAGRGDDRFSTRDSSVDTIRCGDGEDIVWSDRRDRVSADCEHVYRTEGEVPERPPEV